MHRIDAASAANFQRVGLHLDRARLVAFVAAVLVVAASDVDVAKGEVHTPDVGGPFSVHQGPVISGFVSRRSTNVEKLFRKLGDDFIPYLMSVERPSSDNRSFTDITRSLTEYDARLLQNIDFSVVDETTGELQQLKPSVRKVLEKWLLQHASCPLQPAWTDLGETFWPRWVRRGSCGDRPATTSDGRPTHHRRRGRPSSSRPSASCSWPPGMRCVPEVSRKIRLLHWRCTSSWRRRRLDGVEDVDWISSVDDRSSGRRTSRHARRRHRHRQRRLSSSDDSTLSKYDVRDLRRRRCRWKKVPYQVTTGCFCSC